MCLGGLAAPALAVGLGAVGLGSAATFVATTAGAERRFTSR